MPRTAPPPVTPSVLAWAIRESGIAPADLASALKVDVTELEAWQEGTSKPGLTQLRGLASRLHRQLAVFFLPRPPAVEEPALQFRNRIGGASRSLLAVERRIIRRAARLQRVLSWIHDEMSIEPGDFPEARLTEPAANAAERARSGLEVTVEAQRRAASAAAAFDLWRDAVESKAEVYVFLYPLGREACRAITLWDSRAPVVVVNTAWSEEARTFSLLHELGHVMTRTSSACAATPVRAAQMRATWEPTERWCEQFAAAVLLPEPSVRAAVRASAAVNELAEVRRIASAFRVSLSAMVLRLIELDLANWSLWDLLPKNVDDKAQASGGKGRSLAQAREDQIGHRATSTFKRAVAADVLSETQALSYVDAPADLTGPF